MGVKTKIGIKNSATPDDIRDKVLYDLCVPSNAGKYLAFDANGELITKPPLTIDAAMSSTSTNPVQNKVINVAITNLQSQITALDPGTKTITVTASTQADKKVQVSGVAVVDYTTSSGSGGLSSVTYYDHQVDGVSAGTYTLKSIIQQLVNKSHTHRTEKNIRRFNCDCDCSGG